MNCLPTLKNQTRGLIRFYSRFRRTWLSHWWSKIKVKQSSTGAGGWTVWAFWKKIQIWKLIHKLQSTSEQSLNCWSFLVNSCFYVCFMWSELFVIKLFELHVCIKGVTQIKWLLLSLLLLSPWDCNSFFHCIPLVLWLWTCVGGSAWQLIWAYGHSSVCGLRSFPCNGQHHTHRFQV